MMSAERGEEQRRFTQTPHFLFVFLHAKPGGDVEELPLRGESVTSFASRLHHHAPADGVEGVGHQAGDGGHGLSDHPAHHDVCVLGVGEHSCKTNGGGNVTPVSQNR